MITLRSGIVSRGFTFVVIDCEGFPSRVYPPRTFAQFSTAAWGHLILTSGAEPRISMQHMPSSRVLLVDDYKQCLKVLRSILPTDRFQIVGEAFDGVQAVKMAELLQPDLVLLDVSLPKLNGIEVARALKSLALRSAILMLSQDSSSEVVAEALSAGALGYVHKQRVLRDLLAAIESVLSGQRFVSENLVDRESGPSFALAV